MHREVMHESRPEQQQQKAFGNRVVPTVGYIDTSIYYCCKSIPVLLHNVMVGRWIASYVFILFERSEFPIATSPKKKLRVCVRRKKVCVFGKSWFSCGIRVCSTHLGFSVGNVLCTIRMYLASAGRSEVGYKKVAWMLFANSCRCSVGGETIRL